MEAARKYETGTTVYIETEKESLLSKCQSYLYVAPAILTFLIFFLFPIGYLFYLSFTSWNLISPDKEFVGLDNYRELFSSKEFHEVLINTLIYTFATVALSLVISLAFALLLNRKGMLPAFIQGAIFSPHVISLVSISLLWLWMMDPQYGLLNAALELIGLPKLQWLASTDTALLSLIVVGVWKVVGYNTLIFIAGLQSIPQEVYEAAALDDAGPWSVLTRITIPLLSPTIFFLLVISTISSFQVFDTVSIMTQGGPANSTNMLVFYIYQYGFDFFKIGYASAAAIILLVFVGLLTIFHFRLLARRVHYR